jgi:hypothetical protein
LGAAYGNFHPDITGDQPERDIFCCHAFPVNLAMACNLIVHFGVRIIALPVSGEATTHTEYHPFGITFGTEPHLRRLRRSNGLCLTYQRIRHD